jgi:hypothetical protein
VVINSVFSFGYAYNVLVSTIVVTVQFVTVSLSLVTALTFSIPPLIQEIHVRKMEKIGKNYELFETVKGSRK